MDYCPNHGLMGETNFAIQGLSMGGNRIDQRAAGVAGYAGMRRICGTIASALIPAFLAVAALAVEAPNSRLADDVALTKAVVSSLAAKDMATVRDRLDPAIGQISDDTLRQIMNFENRPELKTQYGYFVVVGVIVLLCVVLYWRFKRARWL